MQPVKQQHLHTHTHTALLLSSPATRCCQWRCPTAPHPTLTPPACRPLARICPLTGTENAHATAERPLYTLEVCMTGLAPSRAVQFFRSDDYVSAQHTTEASGIQGLVPGAGAGQAGRQRAAGAVHVPACMCSTCTAESCHCQACCPPARPAALPLTCYQKAYVCSLLAATQPLFATTICACRH